MNYLKPLHRDRVRGRVGGAGLGHSGLCGHGLCSRYATAEPMCVLTSFCPLSTGSPTKVSNNTVF